MMQINPLLTFETISLQDEFFCSKTETRDQTIYGFIISKLVLRRKLRWLFKFLTWDSKLRVWGMQHVLLYFAAAKIL